MMLMLGSKAIIVSKIDLVERMDLTNNNNSSNNLLMTFFKTLRSQFIPA